MLYWQGVLIAFGLMTLAYGALWLTYHDYEPIRQVVGGWF